MVIHNLQLAGILAKNNSFNILIYTFDEKGEYHESTRRTHGFFFQLFKVLSVQNTLDFLPYLWYNKVMINFHIVSIFPKMVEDYCGESILKRAKDKNLVDFKFYNIRDYSVDKHKKVDDKPYSGGPGMVMTAAPILACVDEIKNKIVENGGDLKKSKDNCFCTNGRNLDKYCCEKIFQKIHRYYFNLWKIRRDRFSGAKDFES